MKIVVLVIVLSFTLIVSVNGQNLGVNATGATPHPSALLDVDATPSNNKGILIPRIALQATNISNPVTAPATSLLVYNTATASSGTTAVVPGYYYWDGVKWLRLANGLTASDSQTLSVTGNTLSISGGNSILLPCACTGISSGGLPVSWAESKFAGNAPITYTTLTPLTPAQVSDLTDNNTATTFTMAQSGLPAYHHLGVDFGINTQVNSIQINALSYIPWFTDFHDVIIYGSFNGSTWNAINKTTYPDNLSPVETMYLNTHPPYRYYYIRTNICSSCNGHIIQDIIWQ